MSLDKAQPDAKHSAHIKFQEIACAYAVLSDERRRKRFDATGNTAESLDIDDDAFDWIDFFRTQWAEAVTGERLNNFKSTYQNSDEEKRDVLIAYRSSKGKLNSIFNTVMLSNPLDDEDRFRGYIDQAIKDSEVEAYDAYVHEPKTARKKRYERAKKESEGAKEHAKTLGVYDSLFGGDKAGKANKKAKGDTAEPDLAALLQQRANGRAATFLENLEAKYAGGKNGARQKATDEPSEEAFQKTAAKMKKRKRVVEEEEKEKEEKGDDEDEVDIDLEQDSPAEEPVVTKNRRKSKRAKRGKRSKR